MPAIPRLLPLALLVALAASTPALAANTADASDPVLLSETGVNVASFSELPDGELLIVSYTDGVFRLARD